MSAVSVDSLDWEKTGGLLPAVVQDADTHAVLMLGYMNAEALRATQSTGQVTFYSRSRQRLWRKGETSGNSLQLVELRTDCDADALLIRVRPTGPVCHTGAESCFGDNPPASFLGRLARVIGQRSAAAEQGESYTARLLAAGTERIAQKVGEEGVETALAAVTGRREALVAESADLLYHLLVLLQAADLSLVEVEAELAARHTAPRPDAG